MLCSKIRRCWNQQPPTPSHSRYDLSLAMTWASSKNSTNAHNSWKKTTYGTQEEYVMQQTWMNDEDSEIYGPTQYINNNNCVRTPALQLADQ